jgi:poly-gamma-glutamate capsule biosynthesis protein CapA/YwtB (metallophosphatase superfamily)
MAMGVVVAPLASGSRPAAGRPAGHDRADSAAGVRVCAGGDVTLGSNLDTTWIRKMTGLKVDSLPVPDSLLALHMASPDSLVARLRRFVAGADVVLFNAEGAIGDGVVLDPKCHPGHQLCYALRSRAVAASALRTLADTPAVVVANVANNHAHDAGAAGFDLTVALLDSAGVRVTGADTIPTIVTTARGDTVAILGFSAWSDPGVADTAAVRRLVARAAARYGRVIVTAHLGAEGQQAQRTRDSLEQFAGERRGNSVVFAHIAVDAGAGLVIGHGPHVLRAAEWRHGALIFYSLGNLMSYGPFDLREPMARGAVACATIDSAGRPHEVILQPTVQLEPGMVRRDATRRRALALVDSLSRLDFPATGAAVDRVTGAVTSRPRASRAVAPGALNRRRRDR